LILSYPLQIALLISQLRAAPLLFEQALTLKGPTLPEVLFLLILANALFLITAPIALLIVVVAIINARGLLSA